MQISLSATFKRHSTLVLIMVCVLVGVRLLYSLFQFYEIQRDFVNVNFDSVYNTRAMLKSRLSADRFLTALLATQDYADAGRLATAAEFLDAQILQEKNFSYNADGPHWLAPRLQSHRNELEIVRKSVAESGFPNEQLAQLIANTRTLIRDMDDAERGSWGELAATNLYLDERLSEIGTQIRGIGSVFVIMAAILAWLIFTKAATESKLIRSTSIEKIILERSPIGIVLTTGLESKTVIASANAKFADLIGQPLETLVGMKFYDVMYPVDEATGPVTNELGAALANGEPFTLEGERMRKNGELLWYKVTCKAIDSDDLEKGIIWLFDDITERRKSEETVWRQANFDTLTGLPNRRMFHDRLAHAVATGHRTGHPLSLMFLDLDGFKEVNDTLGHDIGDLLLKETAERLCKCIRETDTVARLGGDEFTIILGELHDASSIERLAQLILQQIARPYFLKGEQVFVTASIGITVYPDDGKTVEVLLKNADQAMYAAKNEGRNRRSYFTPALQTAAQLRLRLINDLRKAIDEEQFEVYYQPIIEMATGTICKAEALLRWNHPTRGMIQPQEFILTAEETGLINPIGEWVFREAAHQASSWCAANQRAFQISINVSPVQFNSAIDQDPQWSKFLRSLGISGANIVVEITEGLLLSPNEATTAKIFGFRDAGIQVSLDDFGTGYASLSYLKHFDIDYLKIDQSFVRNLAPGSQDMVLSEAIILMAHKLGLKVIAEGVETAAQRDLLLAAGCDYAQGFLYSRPLPAEDFERLLAI
ncbi:GGDEF and EAL domain-containing protein [Janthinobacterium sp. 17J80-10]|uniref:putative bifunctional diguanylate cyclase/phosphodiesterase n=1 Tax=Janthinobacterium sp. 17J80-10 TaxID=2497863 RepID=UPI00100597A1|nr:GGDEF and EAL domain-containing protein [Janthinobacterium sp. 17J80-10]QAU35322.1 GGDEF and EAL domain-containing protein [Janthinobacterium sp. 17J80-10]